jgi:vacuolar protein sorting-associated protein 35
MDRLAEYALNNDAISSFNSEVNIYNMFKSNIDKILENSGSIEFKNLLDL